SSATSSSNKTRHPHRSISLVSAPLPAIRRRGCCRQGPARRGAPPPLWSPGAELVLVAHIRNEAQLPRVPLPMLEESCDGFIDWCASLWVLGDEEFRHDRRRGDLVRASWQPSAQAPSALEQYEPSGGAQSRLDPFWSYRYLGRRDAIALDANFFVFLKSSRQSQIELPTCLDRTAI